VRLCPPSAGPGVAPRWARRCQRASVPRAGNLEPHPADGQAPLEAGAPATLGRPRNVGRASAPETRRGRVPCRVRSGPRQVRVPVMRCDGLDPLSPPIRQLAHAQTGREQARAAGRAGAGTAGGGTRAARGQPWPGASRARTPGGWDPPRLRRDSSPRRALPHPSPRTSRAVPPNSSQHTSAIG